MSHLNFGIISKLYMPPWQLEKLSFRSQVVDFWISKRGKSGSTQKSSPQISLTITKTKRGPGMSWGAQYTNES
jgi:hypothetical protein